MVITADYTPGVLPDPAPVQEYTAPLGVTVDVYEALDVLERRLILRGYRRHWVGWYPTRHN